MFTRHWPIVLVLVLVAAAATAGEIHQAIEKGPFLMYRIETFSLSPGHMDHFGGNDLHFFFFKPFDYASYVATGHAIGFYD